MAVVQGQATVPGLQEGQYSVYFWGPGNPESFAEGSIQLPATGVVPLVLTARTMGP